VSLFRDLCTSAAAQISGQRCRQHVAHLSQIHRIMGSPGYGQALAYVQDQLHVLGIGETGIERFPMDGTTAYGDWIAPVAWAAHDAELWLETPERARLCSYAETPICLHVGSQSTPPGGFVGELVDVGAGLNPDDYGGQNVNGRMVLAYGNAPEVYAEAIRRRGARGIVHHGLPWPNPAAGRTSLDMPDLVSYGRLDIRRDEIGNGAFSFAISARQGEYLRRLLRRGPVQMRATVEAVASAGHLEILHACIPGSGRAGCSMEAAPSLVLMAHLCHPQPGANDNASGPALILELVRSLLAAPQPLHHDLHLLFVPEGYGTAAWLQASRTSLGSRRLVLNLDMVGADVAQTGGQLWLDRTPWSTPTYTNDLLAGLLAQVSANTPGGWRCGARDHMGGSDHALFLAPEYGTPALMLGHFPDRFYHSDQDTVDKTSAAEFERVGQVVMAALLAVDQIDGRRARSLAHQVFTAGLQRLAERGGEIVQQALNGDPVGGDYHTGMQVLLDREQAALRSIVADTCAQDRATVQAEIQALGQRLAGACREQLDVLATVLGPSGARPATPRDRQVPRRLFPGPISTHLFGLSRFLEALGDRRDFYHERTRESMDFVRWLFEAGYLMDGRRTLGRIQDVLAAEFGAAVARVEHLHHFVDDLVFVGMAELEP
jgi:aminopeptidase YwaD